MTWTVLSVARVGIHEDDDCVAVVVQAEDLSTLEIQRGRYFEDGEPEDQRWPCWVIDGGYTKYARDGRLHIEGDLLIVTLPASVVADTGTAEQIQVPFETKLGPGLQRLVNEIYDYTPDDSTP